MLAKLSTNREKKGDYFEQDAFDFKIKAQAIISFLEYNVNTLLENKMIALYGNWGSGKTSLMRCIEERVDKKLYEPIFFEAWQHEKDENLAMSLCDLLTSTLKGEEKLIKTFKEKALNILKGFASGVNVKLGSKFLGLELEIEGEKVLKGLSAPSDTIASAYTINAEFKASFKAVEDALLKQFGTQRLIVFVDDLDRCEPENVLNLITALKLFFTYGESTIFFCGLDKEAVTKAVRNKYRDVIKSDEYLEKVFDITFHMPKSYSLEKLLGESFGGDFEFQVQALESNAQFLNHFFASIHFTNPRHIKKVLNKYAILRSFRNNDKLPDHIKAFLPDLLDEKGEGNIFETMFCLFFIILYEFYPSQFSELEHYNRKHKQYLAPALLHLKTITGNPNLESAADQIKRIYINDLDNWKLKQAFPPVAPGAASHSFTRLLFVFSNASPGMLGIFHDKETDKFGNYFLDQGILTLFCKFLIKYQRQIVDSKYSDYVFWNYFQMANHLL